ncbi:MAG: hypothetical protein HYS25_15675 [Ignavibacteriales bacterium]|nr:hypothetical protein [Ignavibacteriales bacterium]
MNLLWDSILEQEKTKEILEQFIIKRRVPHALIFSGPEGVGKFFTAIQFAKILYSSFEKHSAEHAHKAITNLQEPFLKLVIPLPRGRGESSEDSSTDKLSKEQLQSIQSEMQKKIQNPYYKISLENANTIKISSIREIKKFLSTNYDDIPFRFVIICEAELMNPQSQNALLKSLEEPPEGLIFVLITKDKNKLLSTIQSRCWAVDFEPLSAEAVKRNLISFYSFDEAEAEKVSVFSEGSLQTAIELSERNIDKLMADVISVLRYSLAKRFYSAKKDLSGIVSSKSAEDLKLLIKLIKFWISDTVKNRNSAADYYFGQYRDTIEKFNQKFSSVNTYEIFNRLDVLEDYCDRNLNLNVLLLNLIFEIASISIRK